MATPTTWTITLEDQGVPPLVANHRRSPDASLRCSFVSTYEHGDSKKGKFSTRKVMDCKTLATGLDLATGVSFCADHFPS